MKFNPLYPMSTEEKRDQLRLAAQPLIEYLKEHWHPHATVIVTPAGVELLIGEISVQDTP
jgi:hypothetical protein